MDELDLTKNRIIHGEIVDVDGEPGSGAAFLIIRIDGVEREFLADNRMLLNALIDGGFKKGDKIIADVDGDSLYSFGHLE